MAKPRHRLPRPPRPVHFSELMVRALLRGEKTQMRRLVRSTVPPPPAMDAIFPGNKPKHAAPYLDSDCCRPRAPENPRGMSEWWSWWTRDDRSGIPFLVDYVPGDRLWVRERARVTMTSSHHKDGASHAVDYAADHQHGALILDLPRLGSGIRSGTAPSRFPRWTRRADGALAYCSRTGMPRWASRLTLVVEQVRLQRLQDISEEDALAEGVTRVRDACHVIRGFGYDLNGLCHNSPVVPFSFFWDHERRDEATRWDANPWVQAVTFRVERRNIDAPAAVAVAA